MSSPATKPTYRRQILHQSDAFEIAAIEWTQGALSEMHTHGWSTCAISIKKGLFKNTLRIAGKIEVRTLEAGQVLETPIGALHELECLSAEGQTLHVYTPRILEHVDEKRFAPEPQLKTELKSVLSLSSETNFEQLKESLTRIRAQSISTHSPYFMNQLFSGILPQTLMAESLISQTRTTLATQEASPVFSRIETEIVERLGERIGWPSGSRDGLTVPGGSAANAMAIHLARQKAVPTFKENGFGGEKFRLFVSNEAHYSFKKAAAYLGLGSKCVVLIESDGLGRMIPAQLEEAILKSKREGARPLFVGATCGTTVLGSFDPLQPLSEICERHGVWLHADAAWGGPALFSNRLREQISGIEFADSVTFDAHKLFGAGLTCSFILTRHSGLLLEANDVSGAAYLFHEDVSAEIDRGKMSWQCGRGADALSFWAVWKSFGTQGLGRYVDRLLEVRDQTLAWITSQPRLELISPPSYLNLCLRVAPPTGVDKNWSRSVREKLILEQTAMINYSVNQDGPFLRLILVHPDLQFEHVQNMLKAALAVTAE